MNWNFNIAHKIKRSLPVLLENATSASRETSSKNGRIFNGSIQLYGTELQPISLFEFLTRISAVFLSQLTIELKQKWKSEKGFESLDEGLVYLIEDLVNTRNEEKARQDNVSIHSIISFEFQARKQNIL